MDWNLRDEKGADGVWDKEDFNRVTDYAKKKGLLKCRQVNKENGQTMDICHYAQGMKKNRIALIYYEDIGLMKPMGKIESDIRNLMVADGISKL